MIKSMKSKTCPKCGEDKTLKHFGRRSTAKDGLQTWCRTCCGEAEKIRYRNNPEPTKRQAKASRVRLKPELMAIVNNVRRKYGCAFCGERELCTLDFHHLKARKDHGGDPVVRFIHSGRGMLVKEINKCVVLCSNCHRKVHGGLLFPDKTMLCKEDIVYKMRTYLPSSKMCNCRVSALESGDWEVAFLKPWSKVKGTLVLKTREEKAEFAAHSRKIIAPVNWDGSPDTLKGDWESESPVKIRHCPERFYDSAMA